MFGDSLSRRRFLSSEDPNRKKHASFGRSLTRFRRLLIKSFITLIVVCFLSLLWFLFISQNYIGISHSTHPRNYIYSSAAVASDSPSCSSAGKNILLQGGNAIDASIATALCLGVQRPFASGIGGGGFMIARMKRSERREASRIDDDENDSTTLQSDPSLEEFETITIDFREVAGRHAHSDMYEDGVAELLHRFGYYGSYEHSHSFASSIAVPGEVRGMYYAWTRYGRLPWKQLFQDAIHSARDGFRVEKLLEIRLKQKREGILKSPSLRKIFTNEKGELLREGDILSRPKLAETLEIIANDPLSFYKGDLMKRLVAEIQRMKGYLTEEDFLNYRVIEKEPIVTKYRNYNIYTTPPPSSGVVVSFALKLLHHLRVNLSQDFRKYSAPYLHQIIESLKHAFAHRTLVGDPDFLPEMKNITQMLTQNEEYIQKIASKIHPSHTFRDWSHYAVNDILDVPHDQGTTAFSVVDSDENVVSFVSTINHSFGSRIYSSETGIVLNNHMNDFTVSRTKHNAFGFTPSKANIIAPFKRPLSSMAPLIATDENGRVFLVTGASGGPTILSTVFQVVVAVIDSHILPQAAVTMPRIHVLPSWSEVKMERGLGRRIIQELEEQYGHTFMSQEILADGHSIGNIQLVYRKPLNFKSSSQVGYWYAASDPRKFGRPDGY